MEKAGQTDWQGYRVDKSDAASKILLLAELSRLIMFFYEGHSPLVRLSLLTMTNPNQLCDVLLFVCSKMADETNLSSKLPVADRTREVWGRKLCWWCLSSGFPLCRFLLGFADSFCFVFTSSPFYEASPLCTILCNLFPWLCWYVEVFKGGFEGVLVSLLLTTMGAFSYLKFSIEDFLWQTFIRHSGNMACPS